MIVKNYLTAVKILYMIVKRLKKPGRISYMKKITIITADNVDIEYRLADVGSRLAASTIDFMIQLFLFIIFTLLAAFVLASMNITTPSAFNYSLSGWFYAIIIAVYFFIYFGYGIICEMLTNGQSPGKMLMSIRVIRESGGQIGLTQSALRNLFKCFVDIFGVGFMLILFSGKCKRVGDMVAGTIVIHITRDAQPQ